jgi:hypothetical protein
MAMGVVSRTAYGTRRSSGILVKIVSPLLRQCATEVDMPDIAPHNDNEWANLWRAWGSAAESQEQLEVLSLIGDVALNDGKPVVHAHLIVGRKTVTADTCWKRMCAQRLKSC